MLKNKFLLFSLIFLIMFAAVSCSKNANKIIDKGVDSTSINIDDSSIKSTENGIGNIINGGYVVQQDNWLYYSNGGFSPICKVDLNDDKKFTYDYNGGSDINVEGDWIYYIAKSESNNEIIKMKTDGTNRSKILNVQSDFLFLKDGWLYYTDMNTGNLFKAKTDGTSVEKLSDDYCTFVNIVGDSIYYCNVSDDRKIYKLVNNKKFKITDSTCSYINVAGDWIYFINETDGKKVYRINTGGNEETAIIDKRCKSINISGNRLYFTITDDDNIHQSKLDGKGQKTIIVNSKTSTPCLSVLGDWIYYLSFADGYKMCKIKSDGTGKTILD